MKIELTGEEKEALRRYQRNTSGTSYIKVTCILMPSKGFSVIEVSDSLGIDVSTVYRYGQRYQQEELAGFLESGNKGYWGLLSSYQTGKLCEELRQNIYTDSKSVALWIKQPSGISIVDSIVPQSLTYENGDNITSSCKLTVYYSKDLDESLKGLTRLNTHYRLKLYAVYSSDATYSNDANDRMLELNISLQDCACCGAYTGSDKTKWLNFMCHNLGADENSDPFKPAAEIHGAKYKFGTKEATMSMSEDQNYTGVISNWSGRSYQSGSQDWLPANDPCPTGWHLPTYTEWDNVRQYNTWTLNPSGTWSLNTFTTGINVGDALFLPAAGYREYTDGHRGNHGIYGDYWSSSTSSSNGQYFTFNHDGPYMHNANRSYGMSVRCVAE